MRDHDTNELPMPLDWFRLNDGPLSLIGLGIAVLAAALLRFPALGTRPPGFADAEAVHALLARQTQAFGLRILLESAGNASPLLAALITLFGRSIGFDVETSRLAAAVLGTLATLFTGLWLRRELGPVWGIAGALVVAGSFWHLLFSRVALSPIAAAAMLGAALWCLAGARARSAQDTLPWHLGLGLAVGLGYLADPTLRALPLLLLGFTIGAIWQRVRGNGAEQVRGWLVASVVALLVIAPFVRSNVDSPRLLTPWSPTPGLPGEAATDPARLTTAVMSTLQSLVLPSGAEPLLNLPDLAFFGMLVLPWAALGVIALIVAADDAGHRPTVFAWSAGVAVLLLSVAAVDPGHPGRLVVASPLLAALPVFGIRAVLGWARSPTVRVALTLLAVFGIGGEMAVNATRYFEEWSVDPETTVAFNAATIAALREIEVVASGEPVFISTRDTESLLAYLNTAERRHTFDGTEALPIPAEESAYLFVPDDAPLSAPLEQMLSERDIALPDSEGYRVYRIDGRIRQALPLSVPTIPFEDGTVFAGHEFELNPDGTVTALVAWRSPPGAPQRVIEARLTPVDRAGGVEHATVELPANTLDRALYQVALLWIDVPDVAADFDLSVSLHDASGSPIGAPGLDNDGFLFLNRYRLHGD